MTKVYQGSYEPHTDSRMKPFYHPNCRCVVTSYGFAIEPIVFLPTHVTVCLDCGTIRYGSIFVQGIRCTLYSGNNKVASRLRRQY